MIVLRRQIVFVLKTNVYVQMVLPRLESIEPHPMLLFVRPVPLGLPRMVSHASTLTNVNQTRVAKGSASTDLIHIRAFV